MKTSILGQSYVARSTNAADGRMVNLYPEVNADAGKEPGFLSRCPGLALEFSIGDGPIRGMWTFDGVLYVVSGDTMYKVLSNYTMSVLGSIANTGQVSMSDNGTQLFVAAQGSGYIYNKVTGVFQQITDPDYPGALTVGYLDGYFVFNEPNSQRIWITQLLDGTSVDALDFASAEGSPDNVVGLIVDHREVWVFGTSSVEVWYNSGEADFPLQRIQGAFNELGCAAAFSLAKMDNVIFWLGSDARGHGVVYRSNGYTGMRVSTHAVEWQIQSYGDISDAVGYTYQADGHAFYVLTFPNADKTWVYDLTVNAWHERASLSNGEFVRHRSNCQVSYNNKILVGDYENGNVYSFDDNVYSDNGLTQKWLRSWRALMPGQNTLRRTSHHSLQLDMESGTGLNDGQGSNPEIMLRWSDDGGHTWSKEHWVKSGGIGEFGKRVIWRRLGMTQKLRDRVYEISGTDPIKIAINGAELLMSDTNG